MEITLTLKSGQDVEVLVNSKVSHQFPLLTVIPGKDESGRLPQPLEDPTDYGAALFAALFRSGSLAAEVLQQELTRSDRRLWLVTAETTVDAIAWEYLYRPEGFLALDLPITRALPAEQRQAPAPLNQGLQIVAVHANPLDEHVAPLHVEAEWKRLEGVVREAGRGIKLERVRPATQDALRKRLANQSQRVVHFTGHGVQGRQGAVLLFEDHRGGLQPVSAHDYVTELDGTTFLAVLSACVSATPGETGMHNLARALVGQAIPYAIGMRVSVVEEDALIFTRRLYEELSSGTPVEKAMFQARRSLARQSQRSWAMGVPVIYTSLTEPACGFVPQDSSSVIHDLTMPMDLFDLPAVEATFLGRITEQKDLIQKLTGEVRPRLVTIHGAGGQGKTALARQIAERCVWAWSGGVLAVSLESLMSKDDFVLRLAQFLGLSTREFIEPQALERAVIFKLNRLPMLLLVDNAETLIEKVQAGSEEAVLLAGFLRESLSATQTTLLITSRWTLDWPGEERLELDGLLSEQGAKLFIQQVPERYKEISFDLACKLSVKVDGHPLSLILLGISFNEQSTSINDFILGLDETLSKAENKYKSFQHRHRRLFAAIDYSTRTLDPKLRDLLTRLTIFHAAFLPNIAVALLDSDSKVEESVLPKQLLSLYQRSLLQRNEITLQDSFIYYRLQPAIRNYALHVLSVDEPLSNLQLKFGEIYANFIKNLSLVLDLGPEAIFLARLCEVDFERALEYCPKEDLGWYQLSWGLVLIRLGKVTNGIALMESALEIAQGQDLELELRASNQIGVIYQSTGQPYRALRLLQSALAIAQNEKNLIGEASIINNLGMVYEHFGKLNKALEYYKRGLTIAKKIGSRKDEGVSLNNIGNILRSTGRLREALHNFHHVLDIMKKEGNRAGEASSFNNIGLIHDDLGQYKEALTYHQSALKIRREIGDKPGEAISLGNIALAYQSLKQTHDAVRYCNLALHIQREMGDRKSEATTLNNIGIIFFDNNELEKARHYYELALSIEREVENLEGEASTLHNLSEIYYRESQMEVAIDTMERVLQIYEQIGMIASEIHTLFELATMKFFSTKNVTEAVFLLNKAITLFETHNLETDERGLTVEDYLKVLNKMRGGQEENNTNDQQLFMQMSPYLKKFSNINDEPNRIVAMSPNEFEALTDFLNTNNWTETRQVMERQKSVLLQISTIKLLQQLVTKANHAGDQGNEEKFRIRLELLTDAHTNGITAAFQHLFSKLGKNKAAPQKIRKRHKHRK